MKVVVIGINHAGTSAVRTLLAQDSTITINAYDRNTNISFLGCGIALAVGGVVKDAHDLFYCNKETLEGMGANVFMEHDVIAINCDAKSVTIKDLKSGDIKVDSYDKLIYATGSWPMDIPGLSEESAKLENVKFCKLFQHAQELIAKADEPGIDNVAVIGAGYIGIELAEAYRQKGKNVTLIDLMDRVVPRYFDPEFTDSLEDDMRAAGVTMAMGERMVDFKGEDGAVKAVITDKGEYPADLVIKCIGFRPNSQLLPDAKKLRNGAIVVNGKMETSIPDIYAIGDTVALYHAATREHQQVALATNAVKTGLAAAFAICGVDGVEVESVVGTNAISVFENNLASTGLSESAAKAIGLDVETSYIEDADRPEFMNEFGKVKIKLVYEKKDLRLVGAQIGSCGKYSHTEVIYFLALAIQQGLTLPKIAFSDVYFLPHFNKPFNFILTAILQAINLDYDKVKK